MNRNSMEAAAGRNIGRGDVRKENGVYPCSSSNPQVIFTIDHFIGQAMDLCLAQEINKKRAQRASTKQIRHGVSPQAAVEHEGTRHARDQRGGTQPNPALEQGSAFERDDLQG